MIRILVLLCVLAAPFVVDAGLSFEATLPDSPNVSVSGRLQEFPQAGLTQKIITATYSGKSPSRKCTGLCGNGIYLIHIVKDGRDKLIVFQDRRGSALAPDSLAALSQMFVLGNQVSVKPFISFDSKDQINSDALGDGITEVRTVGWGGVDSFIVDFGDSVDATHPRADIFSIIVPTPFEARVLSENGVYITVNIEKIVVSKS